MNKFSIFFIMKVCYVFSLIDAILMKRHNVPFSINKKKITLNYPKSADT